MALKERIEHNFDLTSWKGEIPIHYLYTYGVAGEKFFKEIKDNARLMGTKCPECDIIYLPARMYCERCFAKLEEWLEVSTKGYIYSYTVSYACPDGSLHKEPHVIAFVKIEGIEGGIVNILKDVNPKDVKIGMPVKIEFEKERKGGIFDIKLIPA